jgi:hypothetical protein
MRSNRGVIGTCTHSLAHVKQPKSNSRNAFHLSLQKSEADAA